MPKGTIKWFNKEKGFGFITPDDGEKDLFIHSTNVDAPDHALQDGQRVEFEVSNGRKGPEAIDVRPI